MSRLGAGGRVRLSQLMRSRARFVAAGLAAAGLASGGLLAWAGPAVADTTCLSIGTGTVVCTFTGGPQYWTVPAGVTQGLFLVYGAEGGAADGPPGNGGLGAEVSATLPFSPGDVLQVNVGQAGASGVPALLFGGGESLAGSGGGASDVRYAAADGSYPLANRLLVAGGGGGTGAAGVTPGGNTSPGGMGGNADSPGAGGTSVSPSTGGLVDGGAGGGSGIYSVFLNGGVGGEAIGTSCLSHAGALGVDGSLGTGGGAFTAGGGGGSGYYGGGQGGGGGTTSCGYTAGAGGGGGGSSYPAADVVTDAARAPDDSPNGEVVIQYSVNPSAQPQVTTTSLPSAVAGTPYSATLTGSGGTAPYAWSLDSGSLPDGLSLSPDGTISGTPTTAGTPDFTVELTDSTTPSGQTATQQLSITVSEAAPAFTSDSPPLTSGHAATYQYQFAATDAASWSLSSDAPSWLTISATGLVSGTPPDGTTSFTSSVIAANSASSATAGPYTVAVAGPAPAPDLQVTDTASPNPVISGHQLTYTITVANTGGAAAADVVVVDTLPASVHFDSAATTQGSCTRASSGNNKTKGGTVTCKVNTPLAAGATVTVTITVTTTTPGAITDNAGVIASGVTADSDDTATTTVTVHGT